MSLSYQVSMTSEKMQKMRSHQYMQEFGIPIVKIELESQVVGHYA